MRRPSRLWLAYNLFRLVAVVFLVWALVGQFISLAHDIQEYSRAKSLASSSSIIRTDINVSTSTFATSTSVPTLISAAKAATDSSSARAGATDTADTMLISPLPTSSHSADPADALTITAIIDKRSALKRADSPNRSAEAPSVRSADTATLGDGTVPTSLGGVFFTIMSRLISALALGLLCVAQVGWPEMWLYETFPIFGPQSTSLWLGIGEVIVATESLRVYSINGTLIPDIATFIIGLLNIILGIVLLYLARRNKLPPSPPPPLYFSRATRLLYFRRLPACYDQLTHPPVDDIEAGPAAPVPSSDSRDTKAEEVPQEPKEGVDGQRHTPARQIKHHRPAETYHYTRQGGYPTFSGRTIGAAGPSVPRGWIEEDGGFVQPPLQAPEVECPYTGVIAENGFPKNEESPRCDIESNMRNRNEPISRKKSSSRSRKGSTPHEPTPSAKDKSVRRGRSRSRSKSARAFPNVESNEDKTTSEPCAGAKPSALEFPIPQISKEMDGTPEAADPPLTSSTKTPTSPKVAIAPGDKTEHRRSSFGPRKSKTTPIPSLPTDQHHDSPTPEHVPNPRATRPPRPSLRATISAVSVSSLPWITPKNSATFTPLTVSPTEMPVGETTPELSVDDEHVYRKSIMAASSDLGHHYFPLSHSGSSTSLLSDHHRVQVQAPPRRDSLVPKSSSPTPMKAKFNPVALLAKGPESPVRRGSGGGLNDVRSIQFPRPPIRERENNAFPPLEQDKNVAPSTSLKTPRRGKNKSDVRSRRPTKRKTSELECTNTPKPEDQVGVTNFESANETTTTMIIASPTELAHSEIPQHVEAVSERRQDVRSAISARLVGSSPNSNDLSRSSSLKSVDGRLARTALGVRFDLQDKGPNFNTPDSDSRDEAGGKKQSRPRSRSESQVKVKSPTPSIGFRIPVLGLTVRSPFSSRRQNTDSVSFTSADNSDSQENDTLDIELGSEFEDEYEKQVHTSDKGGAHGDNAEFSFADQEIKVRGERMSVLPREAERPHLEARVSSDDLDPIGMSAGKAPTSPYSSSDSWSGSAAGETEGEAGLRRVNTFGTRS